MVGFLAPYLARAGRGAVSGFLGGGGALGLAAPAFGGGRRRRRRGRGLTAREKADLLFVKEAVGRTAAAQYLALLRNR